ncbi:MAG TPA: hypothetical protein VK789_19540 [Bryobacteraceae bacterium]|nr:hypothetical protein [Bryobacteraceae bacterium]
MTRAWRTIAPCGIVLTAILTLARGWAEEPREPADPVARLEKQLEAGRTTLEYRDNHWGYLESILKHLDINIDSQVLVFSKTSFQADIIGPKKPRALYFNDGVAVGYVQNGPVLEFITVDPAQQVNFYTLDVAKSDKPRFERQDRKCTNCHGVGAISRWEVQSTIPEADGTPFVVIGGTQPTDTDDRTPLEKRWGGWYVSGTHGSQHHMGNAVAPDLFHPFDLETAGTQNLASLASKFDAKNYLAPTSDIVALMTLEHQTRMIWLMMNVSRLFNAAKQQGGVTGHNADALNAAVDEMVTYMLFADEAPLTDPVKGVSTFTETFPKRGPRDMQGRSLRDFDLKTRMFRYPLSYMIYSELFDSMPDIARQRVYQRIYDVLTGKETSPKFARLSPDDRRAILEIVRDTKTNLPEYWTEASSGPSTP